MEANVGKLFEQLTEEVQSKFHAMNCKHQEAWDASERRHKAEWTVMSEYFNRLEERLGLLEEYVKDTSKEFIQGHVSQFHKMYAMDRRHSLRHDVAFNTLFRHMQGNEGVFDRWSNRLSRIEARLNLPVGTFEDYNPLRSGEYEQAVQIADSVGADTDDDEHWERLMSAHERYDIMKAKLRDGTPRPQHLRGDSPPPEPGPSRFPGNYRTPSPVACAAEKRCPPEKKAGYPWLGMNLQSRMTWSLWAVSHSHPANNRMTTEVEFVEPRKSPSPAEPAHQSDDIQNARLSRAAGTPRCCRR